MTLKLDSLCHQRFKSQKDQFSKQTDPTHISCNFPRGVDNENINIKIAETNFIVFYFYHTAHNVASKGTIIAVYYGTKIFRMYIPRKYLSSKQQIYSQNVYLFKTKKI